MTEKTIEVCNNYNRVFCYDKWKINTETYLEREDEY